jgi:hypothetical protein
MADILDFARIPDAVLSVGGENTMNHLLIASLAPMLAFVAGAALLMAKARARKVAAVPVKRKRALRGEHK